MIHFEETETLIIAHKPSGMPCVPAANSTQNYALETALEIALKKYPTLTKVRGHKESEPSLLHRIDNGTSGLLLFAKTQTEFDHLLKNWHSESVRKFYKAFVTHPVDPQEINFQIGHSAKSAKKMIAITEEKFLKRIRGNPQNAQTLVLDSKPTLITKENQSAFELNIEIKTGVRHQIRVHLAALKNPIVGDLVYNGTEASRLYLHSSKCILKLASGETLTLESPFL